MYYSNFHKNRNAPAVHHYAIPTGLPSDPDRDIFPQSLVSREKLRIMHFNTKDRQTPANTRSSNCVIQFPWGLLRNVRKVFPVSSEFPNTQFVINQYNNVLYYEYGNPAANATFTIPPGNHTAAQLVVLLQAEFDAVIGVGQVLVAFDPLTEMFSFSRVAPSVVGDFLTFPFLTNPTSLLNQAYDLLGFTKWNDHTTVFGGATMESDKCANLSGVNYVIVDIKELSNDSDIVSSAFMKIQMVLPPDNMIFDEFISSGRLFDNMPTDMGRITIKIYNPDGTEYLMNECDWSFSLAFLMAAS